MVSFENNNNTRPPRASNSRRASYPLVRSVSGPLELGPLPNNLRSLRRTNVQGREGNNGN